MGCGYEKIVFPGLSLLDILDLWFSDGSKDGEKAAFQGLQVWP